MIGSYSRGIFFKMLRNTLKGWLYYLRNERVSHEIFPLNIHEATDFTWSG